MDEGYPNTERKVKELAIDQIDAIVPSPSARAQKVWEVLQHNAPDLTNWDVLCFAAEYLGHMSSANPWLEDAAKRVAKLVYTAHYLDANGLRPSPAITGTEDGQLTGGEEANLERDEAPKAEGNT